MSEKGMRPEFPLGEDGSMGEHVARPDSTLLTPFLSVIESPTPAERTVLLLQEALGCDRTEVASLVGGSEADCSRIAGRAKRSVVARRPRFENASGRDKDPW